MAGHIDFKYEYDDSNWIDEFYDLMEKYLYDKSGKTTQKGANLFLNNFDKQTLANARVYWHNTELVEFWKFYMEILGGLKRKYGNDLKFFMVDIEKGRTDYDITPLNYEMLRDGKLVKEYVSHSKNFSFKQKYNRFVARYFSREIHLFVKMSDKFTDAFFIQSESIEKFYILFLEVNKGNDFFLKRYRVIEILNKSLYVSKDSYFSSPFEKIFCTTNREELLVFLSYLFQNNIKISYEGVEDFLKRQSKYSMKLALNIDLAKNFIFNTHKEYLKYDENDKIVKLGDFPKELLKEKEEIVKELGMLSTGGCPFPQTKGVNTNAFLEHYSYFNDLFMDYLKHSDEFKELFLEK